MLRLITSRSLTALTTLTTLLAPGACGDDSPGSGSDELPITSVGETPPPTTTVDPTVTSEALTSEALTSEALTSEALTDATSTGEPGPGSGATETGGGTTGGCGADDPLCEVPPEEMEPQDHPDGLPSPLPGVYDDMGAAPGGDGVRALIGFATRERAALEQRVRDIGDPLHPGFAEFMTPADWLADHGPALADFELVKAWLVTRGMQVNFEASNRMLIQFSGDVDAFNQTFATTLHICMRKNPQQGNPPFPVYCTLGGFTLPKFVAERTTGLLTADLPADTGTLPGELGDGAADPPNGGALTPARVAVAYQLKISPTSGFAARASASAWSRRRTTTRGTSRRSGRRSGWRGRCRRRSR